MVTKEQVIEVLKKIYDPEIPVDIWELGFDDCHCPELSHCRNAASGCA